MALQLSTGEASATGPRSENQDALRVVTPAPALAASRGYLLSLADGVSQCADGGLAARATLQALALDYYATPETWPVQYSLDRLLTAHNRWLQANGGGQPLLTTLTALVLRGRRYTLAHIGDSRAYLWRDGQLMRLTEDHVWEQPGMQHVLKRAMGLDQHLVVDYREGELQVADAFLLISDGVWSALSDARIAQLLQSSNDVQGLCQALIAEAHRVGSQDNASALLVRIERLPEAAALADTLAQLAHWPLPPRLRAGQHFEGWRVEGLLGESRQSLIYRVSDADGQPWLLKTLPTSRASEEQAGPALLQEEWLLRRVAGRHFPEVHALPQRQHLYYVQREYKGQTLEARLRQTGPLSLAQWQDLAPRLIKALGLLHRRNIVHRDIKPENLLLGDDGELRVLDFGLAYCPGLSHDEVHSLPGTPSYIAPEAFAGSPPNPQHDLYAAGVTLYHLLCGHYPHGEIEAFQRPRFAQPVPVSRYRPDIPTWLDELLARAVDASPEQRFETAEEWLLALDMGERRSLDKRPRPLLEREPLRVWRTVALLSLLINLLLAVLLLK
ncbi:bifunctional protein-serine/threonine kinase/phosphatase [Pseudomonas sp. AA-38]|uniref:bifunctional protein-serine/threonine kinase/phosphatase n=1 Tax=Pseudomonas sp. AA-38 TaxID=3028807 RepID=UPI0023F87F86|nr:bifunctional protein-serine/threonine kinase/phosphatase [Pseudomonas sp. AA-38]